MPNDFGIGADLRHIINDDVEQSLVALAIEDMQLIDQQVIMQAQADARPPALPTFVIKAVVQGRTEKADNGGFMTFNHVAFTHNNALGLLVLMLLFDCPRLHTVNRQRLVCHNLLRKVTIQRIQHAKVLVPCNKRTVQHGAFVLITHRL